MLMLLHLVVSHYIVSLLKVCLIILVAAPEAILNGLFLEQMSAERERRIYL